MLLNNERTEPVEKNKRLQNQALEKEIEEYNEGIEETDKNE